MTKTPKSSCIGTIVTLYVMAYDYTDKPVYRGYQQENEKVATVD